MGLDQPCDDQQGDGLMATYLCLNCNAQLHRSPSSVVKSGIIFCSHRCFREYRLNKHHPNSTCEACGKQYWRKPYDLKRTSHHFCSYACFTNFYTNKRRRSPTISEESLSHKSSLIKSSWSFERKLKHIALRKQLWANGRMIKSYQNLLNSRGQIRSKIEIKFCSYLKERGFKFDENKSIRGIKAPWRQNSRRFDIMFPDKLLIVEIDGTYWHNFPHGSAEDKEVEAQLEQTDWMLLRFWDFEVRKKPSECVEEIAYALSLNP